VSRFIAYVTLAGRAGVALARCRERRTSWRVLMTVAMATTVLMTAGVVPAHATYRGRNGRIAFATDTGKTLQVVKTIDLNGSDLTVIARNASDPNWSPDGTKIVFTHVRVSGPFGHCSIVMSDPDGSQAVDLTGAHNGCDSGPSFTPDGRAIVFIHRCNGCSRQVIWRMDLQGRARTRISGAPPSVEVNDPNVSPDGRTIVFQGQRSETRRALFTVKMNGSHLRRITSYALSVGTRIDWAPNGAHIVFTQYRNGGPGNTALIRPNGSGLVFVTHYDADVGAQGAVYSPDGRWILYRRQNNVEGTSVIWRMHPDGSDRNRIRGLVAFCCLDWGSRPR